MVTVVYYDLIDVLQGKVFTTDQMFGVSKTKSILLMSKDTLNWKNDCKYTYVTKDLHFQINAHK